MFKPKWDNPDIWEDKKLGAALKKFCEHNRSRHNIFNDLSRGVRKGILAGNREELNLLAQGADYPGFGEKKALELWGFLNNLSAYLPSDGTQTYLPE